MEHRKQLDYATPSQFEPPKVPAIYEALEVCLILFTGLVVLLILFFAIGLAIGSD